MENDGEEGMGGEGWNNSSPKLHFLALVAAGLAGQGGESPVPLGFKTQVSCSPARRYVRARLWTGFRLWAGGDADPAILFSCRYKSCGTKMTDEE